MKKGDKVHSLPFPDCPDSKKENGIVKHETPNKLGVFVVYNCGGDWDNYEDYTAASTYYGNLKPGWIDNARNANFSTTPDCLNCKYLDLDDNPCDECSDESKFKVKW